MIKSCKNDDNFVQQTFFVPWLIRHLQKINYSRLKRDKLSSWQNSLQYLYSRQWSPAWLNIDYSCFSVIITNPQASCHIDNRWALGLVKIFSIAKTLWFCLNGMIFVIPDQHKPLAVISKSDSATFSPFCEPDSLAFQGDCTCEVAIF